MKKFVAVILALIYLTASTGATVHMHYCMDKLVDWGLGHNDSDTCSNCGMKTEDSKKGCCKDEHKQVKLQNDQKVADISINLMQLPVLVVPVPFSSYTFELPASIAQAFPVSHAPPVYSDQAVYLRNCVFRI